MIGELTEILEVLLAIELLEYHNKGYLAYDNKRRSEERQKLIKRALRLIK